MKIFESKQAGDLYYMVRDLATLSNIIRDRHIKTSKQRELNMATGKYQHSVSMSRQLNHCKFNSKRWYCGIQIDGNGLSNRYSIKPYSAFTVRARSRNPLRVKSIIEYDDGTYSLSSLNHSTRLINRDTYTSILDKILNAGNEYNQKHRLVVSKGKRSYRGKTAIRRFVYDSPNGGVLIDDTIIPLSVNPNFYESEERIWSDSDYIDISGCVNGVVLPKELESMPESDYVKTYFASICEECLPSNYSIIYYQ